MVSLDQIRGPIAEELSIFSRKFQEAMRSDVPLLNAITRYIVRSKGKQLRPMFVLLSAKTLGNITESTYHAAALIELLHTATLVHDDVVDDAYQRRGFFSINALWKNKIAVLVGDYLLSRGLLLSVHHKEFRLLEIVTQAVGEMSEGELLQIEKNRHVQMEESDYFSIIRMKTASLIAAACASGVASVGAEDALIQQMYHFGQNIGIAFQIKDDVLDWSRLNTGKSSGADLKNKKMTLPLIHALRQLNWLERKRVLRHFRQNQNDRNTFSSVLSILQDTGGIAYAQQKMQEYCQLALSHLEAFPDSAYRTALMQLVQFTIERQY